MWKTENGSSSLFVKLLFSANKEMNKDQNKKYLLIVNEKAGSGLLTICWLDTIDTIVS